MFHTDNYNVSHLHLSNDKTR